MYSSDLVFLYTVHMISSAVHSSGDKDADHCILVVLEGPAVMYLHIQIAGSVFKINLDQFVNTHLCVV